MTVWFTSDLHLGHRMVAGLRGFGTEGESWVDIPAHDAALAKRWDALVDKRDTVWVLGDLCLQSRTATDRALEWIGSRPGTKHLVAGNHDRVHPGCERQGYKHLRQYLEVFESVQPFARRRILGQDVLMSHFPYSGDHTAEDRFPEWRLPDTGKWLLHGHTHSRSAGEGRMIHVGVDAWDLEPVPLETIELIINSEEKS